jgi:hypothetical protein
MFTWKMKYITAKVKAFATGYEEKIATVGSKTYNDLNLLSLIIGIHTALPS